MRATHDGVIDTIRFDPALTAAGPATILLAHGEIKIADSVTIDGPGARLLRIDAQHHSRIFHIVGADSQIAESFTIEGLTLTGGRETLGNADPFSANAFSGGAIRSSSLGELTVENCVLTGNSVAGIREHGGAIMAFGPLTVRRSVIAGNSALGELAEGGGIYVFANHITLVDSTVRNNSAAYNAGGIAADDNRFISGPDGRLITNATVSLTNSQVNDNIGGGVFAFGDVTVDGSEVNNNRAGRDMGGIYSLSDVVMTNSEVIGNRRASLDNPFNLGGGIQAFSATVSQSTVSQNLGIGIATWAGAVALDDCVVSGNVGGGIHAGQYSFAAMATVTVSRSTVTGNSFAKNGGGIFAYGAVAVSESTVSGNEALEQGGGIFSRRTISLGRSVVSGNTAVGIFDGGAGVFAYGDVTLIETSVTGNRMTGQLGGAGGIFSGTNVTIDRSTINENMTANGSGAGVVGRNVTVRDSTVSGNHAGGAQSEGGGIRGTARCDPHSQHGHGESLGRNGRRLAERRATDDRSFDRGGQFGRQWSARCWFGAPVEKHHVQHHRQQPGELPGGVSARVARWERQSHRWTGAWSDRSTAGAAGG